MVSLKDWPSASTVYGAYATLSGSVMLLQTTFNQLLPRQVQTFITSNVSRYFLKYKKTKEFTFIIEKKNGMTRNELFYASQIFTSTIVDPRTDRLKISKGPNNKHITLRLAESEAVVDYFQGVVITWRFICLKENNNNPEHFGEEQQYFEVRFDKKHRDLVLNSYVPFVLEKAEAIGQERKDLKLHTLKNSSSKLVTWDSIKLDHPCTFDKLAMEPSLKKTVIDDLDRFIERKEYYKKVGRAWKRGYLLYGPPGTGKSSLIAAMANYLKFDIYDLQLMNVREDSTLRKLLLSTPNKSILVIEDIDCNGEIPDRNEKKVQSERRPWDLQFTLSGLLNFIDGLWSSCGHERIIIFTTNNKDRLDPALLRPGRMDMHVHMSYLTINGFKQLASIYHDIKDHHWRYREIEELIGSMEVTPAEVAEELMKSSDADLCLGGLVNFLKRKKMDSCKDEGADGMELPAAKRPKTDGCNNG